MTAIAARGEVDTNRNLHLTVPCDLPPGPVNVVVQLPAADDAGIPAELAAFVAGLDLFEDAELWRAARSRLSDDAAARLADLNDLQQRAGLSAAEEAESAALVRQYELALLVRAKAAALLRRRGHDVSSLLQP